MSTNKKISCILPNTTLSALDTFIDGVQIRNRTHAIHLALEHWMEAKRGKGEQLDLTKRTFPKKGKK